MSIRTATLRTFAVVEILEQILLQLPIKDLLFAQRISKSWRTLITTSPTLQAALYFRPSLAVQLSPSETEHKICTINPLIESSFPFLLQPRPGIPEAQLADWKRKLSKLNNAPQLLPKDEFSMQKFWYSKWLFNPEAWRSEEATWRRMHITKEPIQRLVFLRNSSSPYCVVAQECILNLGQQPEPKTTTRSNERTEVPPTVHNSLQGYVFCEPGSEKQQKSWMKIDHQFVDLTRLDGLPMSLVYDYINFNVCRSTDPPRFTVSFHPRYPPERDEFVLNSSDLDVDPIPERLGVGEGLSMVVFMNWFSGCIEGDENCYLQFSSEGSKDIEVGPWVVHRGWIL